MVPEDHHCDPASIPAAVALRETLREQIPTLWVHGTINRRVLDLNRPASRETAFYRQLDRVIDQDTIYCDLHSYPPYIHGTQIAYWMKHEIVLCAYPGINMEDTLELVEHLQAADIDAGIATPDRCPMIRDYFLVQHFGPRAKRAYMVEVNEELSLGRIASVARQLGRSVY